MVLHALEQINQIASGDLVTRCENVSLCDRSFFPIQLDGILFDLSDTISAIVSC